MNSSQVRIRLPEINSAASEKVSPQSFLELEKREWKSSIYKNRPAYLAKKISNDELFGEVVKPAINLGSSQIVEEKVVETENFGPEESDNEEETGQKEIKNIFQKETLVSSKYKEHSKGPAYTKEGQIVKHSIIGSVDMYERCQRTVRKHHQKENGSSYDKDNTSTSESTSRNLRLSSFAVLADQTMNSFGSPQANPLIKRHSTCLIKRESKKDLKAAKEEILTRIDQIKEDESKYYDLEMEKYQHLPLGDQLHHSKQKRCLEKYEKRVTNWRDTIEDVNSKIKRNIGKPVMMRSDDFREKRELSEAFDLVKTDDERFGTTLWYMTLRKYGPEMDTQRMIHDIPAGFNCPQIGKPGSLELIRRTTRFDMSSVSLPPLSETRFLDRTRNEYLLDRSTVLQSELTRILPTQLSEIDAFMIEGRNKLDLEADAFLRVNQNKDIHAVPKAFFEGKKVKYEEEVLHEHYDNKEIVRNGLSAFVK